MSTREALRHEAKTKRLEWARRCDQSVAADTHDLQTHFEGRDNRCNPLLGRAQIYRCGRCSNDAVRIAVADEQRDRFSAALDETYERVMPWGFIEICQAIH
jgi:hypothetical protein